MSSLITRCPACSTMFKVVPDQLRVSDGWVRCGQCNEVFDANSNLQPRAEVAVNSVAAPLAREPQPEPPPPPAPPPPSPSPSPSVERTVPPVAASTKVDMPVEVPVEAKAAIPPKADEAPIVVPVAVMDESVSRALDAEPEAEKPVVSRQPTTLGEHRSSVVRGAKPQRARKEPAPSKAEEPPAHSFMARGAASTVKDKAWTRVVLWIVCLLLLAGLVLQIVVHERDRIAATDPSAVRVLAPLCAALGCSIAPLQQIESVVIDSSSFAKTRADVYRLNFTLKNTAQTMIATPSVELTLTDMQDQAVVRRVFVAAEFGHQQTMGPGTELAASMPVAVKPVAGSAKVSGYRLLSFYP